MLILSAPFSIVHDCRTTEEPVVSKGSGATYCWVVAWEAVSKGSGATYCWVVAWEAVSKGSGATYWWVVAWAGV